MANKLHIVLRERGSPQVISRAQLGESNCIHDIADLARLNIVKIVQSSSYLLVEPKSLVGSYNSPRLRLDVAPKSPELASGLLMRLDNWRRRVDVEDPNKTGEAFQARNLWTTFEQLLSNLHREGLPWIYSRKTVISSTPRGRIDFRHTLNRVLSRGINHQVASSIQARNHFDGFAPSLDAVRRRIATIEVNAPSLRGRVGKLIELTGDSSRPFSVIDARKIFEELYQLEGHPALMAICSFCSQVLRGEDSIRISQPVGSGVAEFVDLERLWEEAVRMLLSHQSCCTRGTVRLHPIRGSGQTLFDDGGPEIDPDIVCYRGSLPILVVDAKYSVAASPSANDIYQLSSYVTRLGCESGALAYVAAGNSSVVRKIGTLDNGRKLFACYISLDAFDSNTDFFVDLFTSNATTVEMF